MATFHLTYSVRVRDQVVATDRDHAGRAAIAAGATMDAAVDAILVRDDAGGVYELRGVCDLCEGLIWDDQAHRPHGDNTGLAHDECPDAGVLARGGGVIRDHGRCTDRHHVFTGEGCDCGRARANASPRGLVRT